MNKNPSGLVRDTQSLVNNDWMSWPGDFSLGLNLPFKLMLYPDSVIHKLCNNHYTSIMTFLVYSCGTN